MVYTASQRFTERKQAATEVKVYSDQSPIPLYHNGK